MRVSVGEGRKKREETDACGPAFKREFQLPGKHCRVIDNLNVYLISSEAVSEREETARAVTKYSASADKRVGLAALRINDAALVHFTPLN